MSGPAEHDLPNVPLSKAEDWSHYLDLLASSLWQMISAAPLGPRISRAASTKGLIVGDFLLEDAEIGLLEGWIANDERCNICRANDLADPASVAPSG